MEQYYYKFNSYERKESNQSTNKKNNIIPNQRNSNLIGKLGLNIVNSVKHNKNYLLADVVDTSIEDPEIKNKFNTPQRNITKFNFLVQKENKSNSLNKNRKKYININSKLKINNMNNIYNPIDCNNYQFDNCIDNYNTGGQKLLHNYLILEEDSIYSYLNLLNIWLEIESNIDNRILVNNCTSKFIDEFERFFMTRKNPTEIFLNETLNKAFNKLLKFALLIVSLIKINILQFNYDYNSRVLIKRYANSYTEIACIFYDMFVFSDVNRELRLNNKELIDKVQRISKSNYSFINKKNKINEVMFHINRLFDNLSNMLKNYSVNHYKSVVNPFHVVFTDLIISNEILKLDFFASIIIKNFLYAMIKKEESYNLITKSFTQNINNEPPYLSKQTDMKYTIVLDLDETLIHFFYTPSGGTFFIRPNAMDFLVQISNFYEVIIFTAATQEYADAILDLIDPNFLIFKYRLYRHHTSLSEDDCVIKDLSTIGRDLSKIIIIDNISENYNNQPNNGLISKTWKDDIFDKQLSDLKDILMLIYEYKLDDVTNFIKNINLELSKYSKTQDENNYKKIDFLKLI